MRLRVIGSGSSGNTYLLESSKEVLIIDAGVNPICVKEALDFDLSKVVGVLVTHEHVDHAKHADYYENLGITVFKPYETGQTKGKYGRFTVSAFPLVHNVPCYGFLINHKDMGNLIYATDTAYIKWIFRNINHFLVEANYSEKLVGQSAKRNHVLTGHMDIVTTCNFLRTNNTFLNPNIENVILCHLSDSNSNEKEFVDMAKEVIDCNVFIADKGLTVDISLVPF